MAKQKPHKPAPAAPKPKSTPKQGTPLNPARPLPTDAFWWFGLVAAALGFVLYANTFGHLYALDDYGCLKDNYIVQGGLKNIGTLFTTEYRYGYKAWGSVGSLYRPGVLTMFAAEWQLAPDNPFLYHFMNALWFGLTGWMLWATWRRILAEQPALLTALAVLFFMAHPVHTEVVANIKSRDEIMSLFFCTTALYAIWRHLESGNAKWLAAAMLAYLFGFFFKESAITFLAVIPLCIWFFSQKSLAENLKITGLMLVPTIVFFLFRANALADQGGKEVYSPLDNFIVSAPDGLSMFASGCMMAWRYLQTLLWPHPLVSELGYPQMQPVGFGDWRALLGMGIFGGAFVWAVLNTGRKHFLAFAILFYMVTFSPYSNLIKPLLIGTSYGERLLFVPSLAFALILGWAICKILKISDLDKIWNPANGLKNTAAWGVAGAIVALYGIQTIARNPAWYDSAALYRADIGTAPNSAKLNYHSGLEWAKLGVDEDEGKVVDTAALQKALFHYSKAIELYPTYHDAFGSRGLVWFRLGDYDKAIADYEIALKNRPNDAKVLSNLGFIYMIPPNEGGRWYNPAKAEEVYRQSVKHDPRFVDGRRNLGAILARQGKFTEAIEQWQEALKIEPNNVTLLFFIGSAYRDMGQPDKAQPWFDKSEAAKRMPKPKE
ncbi:MAG: tetratricopeptide repeat protein [Saprospiraceae bacterium]